ncbi:hypothetical protein HD597_006715 [Nonomuraea thailandensis]|uniref:Uncharacterized protein n=1 Tax=Nonomuraea thailandensis TaxID=1188745 RepID=A0A9X2K4T5_9ACTN|nr:hypothetical protein [Nonomuraea thailandensis]MCP2359695.1 hypothetical protein [Nonomuraea thailandensis]
MTTSQTNQATEWSCYVPMWDDANDEFHNGWLSYRTDDPYFVHLEIEDWHAPVVAPRDVLLDGLNERAECLSKPDRTALRIEPASDGRHVLLGITQGDLLLGVFRAPADILTRHALGFYKLVPTREARIDWDAVIANLMRT